jgi:hypothetical protein
VKEYDVHTSFINNNATEKKQNITALQTNVIKQEGKILIPTGSAVGSKTHKTVSCFTVNVQSLTNILK